MTKYPITNRTNRTLYFDVDNKRQDLYIWDHNDDGLNIEIKPHEVMVLDFDVTVRCDDFDITTEDKYYLEHRMKL